ncbi:MAG: hypothetical protein JXQ99_02290 [Hyphomicrobiaceae bacterium]
MRACRLNRTHGVKNRPPDHKARVAVVIGEVNWSWQNLSATIRAIHAGQAMALAVTTTKRFSATPDVPTVGRLGHPNIELTIVWNGIFGPHGLPQNQS